ncbi:hypothetical protein CsSME_00012283 [Camellia sinensis var. sinensis]|uniref:mavicyanin-like n=1 Tax=Camellia sinensis TaxID=4442 RepID=UPI00103661A1|nr:mavicyanin-like [Camellia sinensis]
MAMAMAMAAAVLALLVVVAPAVQAVQHTVGGTSGWSQTTDYSTWAAGATFTVGDTLLFNYGSSHSVAVMSQSDYNSCNTGNAINTYNGGQTTITLDKPGSMYFACPSFGHCQGGMKMAINVVAATSSTTTPSSGSSPTTPAGSTSPATPTTEPSTTPAITTTTTTPHPYSGAAGSFGSMNLGFSIGLAGLVAFMG